RPAPRTSGSALDVRRADRSARPMSPRRRVRPGLLAAVFALAACGGAPAKPATTAEGSGEGEGATKESASEEGGGAASASSGGGEEGAPSKKAVSGDGEGGGEAEDAKPAAKGPGANDAKALARDVLKSGGRRIGYCG